MSSSEAIYKFHSENPSFWYQKSVSLYASASVIEDARLQSSDRKFVSGLELKGDFSVDDGCEDPYLMLFGLSFELMLKAICVAKKKEFDQVKNDLQRLAETAGIKLTKKENTQLRLLSDFVTWAARYPVPKSYQIMRQHSNSIRKELWQNENLFGVLEVTSKTEVFNHDSLKSVWLRLQEEYWEIT